MIQVHTSFFKSQAQLKRYVQDILSTHISFHQGDELYPFIYALCERHPWFDEKRDVGIHPFTVTDGNKLGICRTDDSLVDISWSKWCVSPNRADNTLENCMRKSIKPQIEQFRTTSQPTCVLCPNVAEHVDHIYEFRKLVADFVKTRSDTPTTFKSVLFSGDVFHEDSPFEAAWIVHHRTHASLRMLCRPCNLRRARPDLKK
jgi:5-methylcytosine-specific restriction endonuclease McrA